MIDHVSLLYATDETLSMNEVAKNISVQYSNISQGQNFPQWDAEGGGLTGHALGSLLEAGNATSAAISFHHNLYAHQKGRMPQMQAGQTGGGYYDFRNNVFYNWFGTAGSRSGTTFVNLVNNFYLAGDGGDNPAGGTNPAIGTSSGGTGVQSAGTNVYRNGNVLDSNKDADANDGVAVSNGGPANPIFAGGVNTYAGVTDTAQQAYDRVLNYVGANWWNRDAVVSTPDERIIQETRTGQGKVIAWADNPWDGSDGAEWQALKNTPQTSRANTWDTEPEATAGYGIGDGMPSWWELAHGLDPNVRDDAGDFDTDGYTNLEEYMNEVAAWPAPAAIVFNGATNTRYAQITNWDVNADPTRTHNWQPSRYDTAHLRSGTTVVDAMGQHAGMLAVAPVAGDNATLNVTAGWINVAAALNVGSAGTGVVNQSNGVVSAPSIILGGAGAASGTYSLTGDDAVLMVGTLAKAMGGGAFNFNGGTLVADTVTFSLINDGGIIAPSDGSRVTHIQGDLQVNVGQFQLDLAGSEPGQYDRVVIDGNLHLASGLNVSLVVNTQNGFQPKFGDAFDLLDFGSYTGPAFFGVTSLPALSPGLRWDFFNVAGTGGTLFVAGVPYADFDGNSFVDGGDLLIWQRNLGLTGQTTVTNGDANHDGTVDVDDLLVWRNQFGTNPAAPAAGANVPEPAAAALAVVAIATIRALSRKRNND
jgi:hypothetical protein